MSEKYTPTQKDYDKAEEFLDDHTVPNNPLLPNGKTVFRELSERRSKKQKGYPEIEEPAKSPDSAITEKLDQLANSAERRRRLDAVYGNAESVIDRCMASGKASRKKVKKGFGKSYETVTLPVQYPETDFSVSLKRTVTPYFDGGFFESRSTRIIVSREGQSYTYAIFINGRGLQKGDGADRHPHYIQPDTEDFEQVTALIDCVDQELK